MPYSNRFLGRPRQPRPLPPPPHIFRPAAKAKLVDAPRWQRRPQLALMPPPANGHRQTPPGFGQRQTPPANGHRQTPPVNGQQQQRAVLNGRPTYLHVAKNARSSSGKKPKTFAHVVAAKPAAVPGTATAIKKSNSNRVVTKPSQHFVVDVLNYAALCVSNLPPAERANYHKSRDQHKLCLIDFVERCLGQHRKATELANKKAKGSVEVKIRRPVIHFCTKYHTASQLDHWKQMFAMLQRAYSPNKVLIEMYVVRGDSKCIDREFNRKHHINCEPDDYVAVALYNVLLGLANNDAAAAANKQTGLEKQTASSNKPRSPGVFLVSRDAFRDAAHVADVYAPKFANTNRSIHLAHKRSADLIRAFSQQYAAAKPGDRKLIVPPLKDRPFI